MEDQTLLEVKNLKKHFSLGKGETLKAVDGISFKVLKGETFGVVGESGCGKSTAGRTIIGLYDQTDGEVIFKGKNIHNMNEKERFSFYRNMQMIFQDPYKSLNPRKKVGWILEEPLKLERKYTKTQRREAVEEMLSKVHLPEEFYDKYPRELSGGQRQRISIALALLTGTKLILADEPLSALDVTVQAQMIRLLKELQEKERIAYLFVSHDLDVISMLCSRVLFLKDRKVTEYENL